MGRRYAECRARRYDAIFADVGYSGVEVVQPAQSVEPARPVLAPVEGTEYGTLPYEALAVIAVDRLCKPLRLALPGRAAFVVPSEWIAAARAELSLCPGCVLRGREVQKLCGHDYEAKHANAISANVESAIATSLLPQRRRRRRGGKRFQERLARRRAFAIPA